MTETIHKIFSQLDSEAEKIPGYDEEIMFDAQRAREFMLAANRRHSELKGIQLDDARLRRTRRTVRDFSGRPLTFAELSSLLGCLKNTGTETSPEYLYPSAGGLYPVDTYVCIKKGGCEGIGSGTYLYLPESGRLCPVSEDIPPVTAHYYNNRNIYSSSSVSLYFFCDCCVSMPKYGSMGLYYGILDSGIMLELITETAAGLSLGSCIIGDLDLKKAGNCFGSCENKVYLHCMEVGHYD